MKKFFAISAIIALPILAAARERVEIGGVTMLLDTVSHRKVAKGTTLTQLHLSGRQPLDVHYFTVDLTVPGVALRSGVPATSTGLEQVSAMGRRLSSAARTYAAGINGDFFDVTATYPDGSLRPRQLTYSFVADGRIIKTSPQCYQMAVDASGFPMIGRFDFTRGRVSRGADSVMLGGVNVENINYSGDKAADNAVTIYTRDGWKSPFQTQFAGACAQVGARFVEGSCIEAGKSCRVVVATAVSDDGNMAVPEDGVVLLGRGTGKSFVDGLQVGDTVTVTSEVALPDGTLFNPLQAVGGNPLTVVNGEGVESDGSRGDAVELHPRTGVGISRDGTRVIMMVVDGRHESVGVTTRQLGDLLVHAGAWSGLNFDGGGSSTCYSSALGVVNRCSDAAGERAVGNGLFVVTEGDAASSEIAEIRFEKWAHTGYEGSTWVPVMYGYNRDGYLVERNLKGFRLSCPPEVGSVAGDSLITLGSRSGVLKGEYNGLSAELPITVLPAPRCVPLNTTLAGWGKNLTKVKTATVTPSGDGFTLDYTMATTVTSAKINLLPKYTFDGEPLAIRVSAASATKAPKKIGVVLKPANSDAVTTVEFADFKTNGSAEWVIPIETVFDITDPAVFPITLSTISIYPAETASQTGRIVFSHFCGLYENSGESGVTAVEGDLDAGGEVWYTLTGMPVNRERLSPGIYIVRKGGKTMKVMKR